MTGEGMTCRTIPSDGHRTLAIVVSVVLGLFGTLSAYAAGPASSPALAPAKARAEEGARWSELKPAQQGALKPLERDWAGIDAPRKQKWLELSARFPKMTPIEQARVQARMAEWAKLTPLERGQARLNFQEAKQVPTLDRQARWESYQALPAEQKRQLAARAASAPAAPPAFAAASPKAASAPAASARVAQGDRRAQETAQAKSNIVPNPAFAAPPKPVAPTVVRASPGATTTLISKQPTPPSHHQTGLPKIAATPEFVDKATLLPRRGPQAAATRSAKASEAEPTQHRQ